MSDESKRVRVSGARCLMATAFCALLLITHHSSLITPASGQPVFGEPRDHYYKARGRSVSVRWVVEPREVTVGRDLTATLVVAGATNPAEVVKPDLRKLKEFDAFKVTDALDPPRDPTAKEVRFAYRLAPRGTDVTEIPALRFHYHNPDAAPGKQFPLTTTDRDEPAPITVREAPKAERPVVPVEAPEFAFQLATGPGVLGGGPFVPCRWGWLAVALFGPLAAGAWYLVWRRVYPDAARLARRRRSRAARRAVGLIQRADRTPDPAGAIARAVLGYLRARFPLPEGAATPSEVAAALGASGVPADVAEGVADVLRGCDRARFAPADDGDPAPAAEALIARLEALA